jgi:hypothetical protein
MGTSASMAGGILTISGGILTALTGTYRYIYISVADPGCLSRIRLFIIPDPVSEFFSYRIPDPHQRI